MKRLISVAMLCAFATAIVGCEASAGIGNPDDTHGKEVHEKTVTDQNGNTVEHEKTVQHDYNP